MPALIVLLCVGGILGFWQVIGGAGKPGKDAGTGPAPAQAAFDLELAQVAQLARVGAQIRTRAATSPDAWRQAMIVMLDEEPAWEAARAVVLVSGSEKDAWRLRPALASLASRTGEPSIPILAASQALVLSGGGGAPQLLIARTDSHPTRTDEPVHLVLLHPLAPRRTGRSNTYVAVFFRADVALRRALASLHPSGAVVEYVDPLGRSARFDSGTGPAAVDVQLASGVRWPSYGGQWRLQTVSPAAVQSWQQWGVLGTVLVALGLAVHQRFRRASLVSQRDDQVPAADEDHRLRAALQDAPFIIWLTDTALRPTYVNAAWSEATGRPTRDALIGGWKDFVHADDLPALQEKFRALIPQPQPVTFRARMRRLDGEYRWHLASLRPRRDAHGRSCGYVGITIDIHEMQDEARRQRDFLDSVLDALPNPIFAKDRDHRLVVANRAFCEWTGVPRERLIGCLDTDYLPREKVAHVHAEDAHAFAEPGLLVTEREAILPSSGAGHVLVSKGVVPLGDGNSYLVGSVTRIDELKGALRRAETSEKLLSQILDALPMPLVVKDQAFRWVMVNDAYLRVVGQTREHAIGRTDADLIDPNEAVRLRIQDEEVLSSGMALVCEEPLTLADGQTRWILKTKSMISTECAGALLVTSSVDITERRSAELVNARNREFLESLLNAMPNIISVKDAESRYVMVNDAFVEWLGRDKGDIVGRNDDDVFDDATAARNRQEDSFVLTSETSFVKEVEMGQIDGASRPWLKSKSLLAVPGHSRYVLTVATDISRLKNAETQAARARQRVELLNQLLASTLLQSDQVTSWQTAVDAVALLLAGARATMHLPVDDGGLRPVVSSLNQPGGRECAAPPVSLQSADWAALQSGQQVRGGGHAAGTEAAGYAWLAAPVMGAEGLQAVLTIEFEGPHEWREDEVEIAADFIGTLRVTTAFLESRIERDRAEQDLRAANSLLDGILNALPVGLCVKDEAGKWIVANRTLGEMSLRRVDEMVGHTNGEIYGPERGALYDEEDQRVLETGEPLSAELRVANPNSETPWVFKSKFRLIMPDGQRYLISTLSDITSSKHAALQIEESHRFLAAVLDALPHGVDVRDEQGTIILANRNCRLAAGLEQSDPVGWRAAEMAAKAGFQRDAERDAQAWQSHGLEYIDTADIGDGAGTRWYLKSKLPVAMSDGQRCLVTVSTDITLLKQAEQAARDARGRLEVLHAIASDMTSGMPLEDLLEHAQSRLQAISDRCRVDIVDWSAVQAGPSGSTSTGAVRALRAVLENHETLAQFKRQEVLRLDEMPAISRSEGEVALRDGHVGALIAGLIADASAIPRHVVIMSKTHPGGWHQHQEQTLVEVAATLKLARLKQDAEAQRALVERDLRDNESVLRATVWASDLGLWTWDLVTNEVRYSARWKSMLGYLPEEIKNDFETWKMHVHPEDLPAAMASIKDAMNNGSARLEAEFRMRHKDGSWRNLLSRAQIMRSTDGSPVRMVGGHIDVTEFRRAQEALRAHRDSLEQLVQERTAELSQAKEQAEAANRAKSEFLANMSHELRTPMHAILSFSKLGSERVAHGTAELPKIATYLDRVHQSGTRLLNLLNDLLDLSKLESGMMRYDLRERNLNDIAMGAVQEFMAYARERDVRLALEAPERKVKLRCDAMRMGQIVRNLVGNAIKFTAKPSQVTIQIEDGLSIDADGTGAVPAVAIRVLDQGKGIPDAELESIFDKFVQSSQTKSGAGGTGLGLAICREITQQHGGLIWARNRPEGGAYLTVLLPQQGPKVVSRDKVASQV